MVLNYEKQIKKAPVKFREDLFYADFFLCPKSVIITSLKLYHGVELRDILNVYLDRTYKKIDHYFFNTQ